MLIRMTAPVKGSASHEMSGSCRNRPGTNPCWYNGLGKPLIQIGRRKLLVLVTQLLGPPPEPPMKSHIGGSNTVPSWARRVSMFPQPACHAMELSEFSARVIPPTAVAQG